MEPDQNKVNKTGRLRSLDALRGFDMFWIVGGGAVFLALAGYTDWAPFNWISEQLICYLCRWLEPVAPFCFLPAGKLALPPFHVQKKKIPESLNPKLLWYAISIN